MPSPYPGMDPDLDARWRDVHSRVVMSASDALRKNLPPDLYARVEERVFVQTGEELASVRYPDVRVVERCRPFDLGSPTAAPPVRIRLRPADQDIRLSLQELITQTYENGNYALTTDNSNPPDPRLSEEDAAEPEGY